MANKSLREAAYHLFISFLLGFIFVFFLILISSGMIYDNSHKKAVSLNTNNNYITYKGLYYDIDYPDGYQLYENKIMATQGIEKNQENTIQLISPPLNKDMGNLSIIIAHKPFQKYLEEDYESTSCPSLYGKRLEPVELADKTFTTSGQIFCGPNEVAFFYILNNNTIFEAKVETTADYEKEALPEVHRILGSMRFNEN